MTATQQPPGGRDRLAVLRPRPRSFGDPIVRSWRLAVAGLVVAAIAALLVALHVGLAATLLVALALYAVGAVTWRATPP